MAVADEKEIRAQFPALERVHGGAPVAHFDAPGGTQVPRSVVAAMANYLIHHNANTHWEYPTSAETDAAIAGAREALADFLGAASDEIAFGANMTTLTFHLARGLGRSWGAGDEVVVTELDHHANIAPWEALARERGIVLRTVPLAPQTGQLDADALARAVGPRTRLLAIGAASNALGTIVDVRRFADLAHAAGALCFVDAVHYVPHEICDVRALGADFLACSAYKFYGPHVGVLYGRKELLERVDVPRLAPSPDTAPERLETGTQNHEGLVGAAAAVDFLADLASTRAGSRRERLARVFAVLHQRADRLLADLWEGLCGLPRVRCYGPPPGSPRTPTLAFSVEGVAPTDVARALAARGVFVSHGSFYAEGVLARLGRTSEGLVRAGCACYTTQDEIDRLVGAVRELVVG